MSLNNLYIVGYHEQDLSGPKRVDNVLKEIQPQTIAVLSPPNLDINFKQQAPNLEKYIQFFGKKGTTVYRKYLENYLENKHFVLKRSIEYTKKNPKTRIEYLLEEYSKTENKMLNQGIRDTAELQIENHLKKLKNELNYRKSIQEKLKSSNTWNTFKQEETDTLYTKFTGKTKKNLKKKYYQNG